MSVGLECRSPFLDVRLAELVTSLPREHKVKGLHGKHVLRRLLGKQVGTAISRRKKLGLSMPIDEWLKDELGPLVRETILAPRARIFAYVQQDQVARLYREHCQGTASRTRILWALLLLELWLGRCPATRVSHRAC
jgi:asparagine synthase (glutamine-hydrolysing)